MDLTSERNSENPKSKNPFLPKLLVGLIAFALIANVAIFSFLIGQNTVRSNKNVNQNIHDINLRTPEALGASNDDNQTNSESNTISITPTTSPLEKQIILVSEAETDGFWNSNSSGSSESHIQVGRNNEFVSRGFVTFDISPLPQNAKITHALLKLNENKKEGEPENKLGDLVVDHVVYGDSLDKNDYGSAAILSTFAQLKKENTTDWWTTDVTQAAVNDQYMTRIKSQFRIHFANEMRAQSTDMIYFYTRESSSEPNNSPRLIINYVE